MEVIEKVLAYDIYRSVCVCADASTGTNIVHYMAVCVDVYLCCCVVLCDIMSL